MAPNAMGLFAPLWFEHEDADGTICFEGSSNPAEEWVFDPAALRTIDDFMAYAAVYVENPDPDPLVVDIGLASDDSAAVLVNTRCVFARSVPRPYGSAGTIQDVIRGVVLRPGRNRILVKVFEGGGVSGFRLRFQDRNGDPVFLPLHLSPGELRFPFRIRREFPPEVFRGETFPVSITVQKLEESDSERIRIKEEFPSTWVITDPAGGTVDGHTVEWAFDEPFEGTITYRVKAPDGEAAGTFSGTWSTENGEFAVGGEDTVVLRPGRGFSRHGFITRWLILGPYELDGCGSSAGGCGEGEDRPCCSAPGDDAVLADYLTDGFRTEKTIRPYAGMPVPTDFGVAASAGLIPVFRPHVNPGGVPRWFDWYAPGGDVDFLEAFGGGDLLGGAAYAAAYVENEGRDPLPVYIAFGSDDSPALLLNGNVVHAENVLPHGRAYGGPPAYQDVVGPVDLVAGTNLLMVKVFQGWEDWNFALRFQDDSGNPITEGLKVLSPSPPAGAGARVRRRLPRTCAGKEKITVALEISVEAGNRIRIEEFVPAGWRVDDSGGAAVEENRLTWSDITSSRTITYSVETGGGVEQGVFSGWIEGSVHGSVLGDCVVERRIAASTPPSPWSSINVGGAWGYVDADSPGNFDVWVKGNDIWNRHDQFVFVYREVSGSFTAVTRVSSRIESHPWAKAGLMVRQTPCSNASFSYVCVTPERGVDFQFRNFSGDSARHAGEVRGVETPTYLLLSASLEKGKIVGAYSRNGRDWKVAAEEDLVNVAPPFLVGLATCSHSLSVRGGASYRDTVLIPEGIMPPEDLFCIFADGTVTLTWDDPISYDRIEVVRYGPGGEAVLGSLAGDETFFEDSSPRGSSVYRVRGYVEGVSLSAECGVDAGPPYRVNCGGPLYVDKKGRGWIEDDDFLVNASGTHEAVNDAPVRNTEDEFLFQSERWWGRAGAGMEYAFPVEDGEYTVELFFDELCSWCRSPFGPDGVEGTEDDDGFGRTFDVFLEGKMVLEGFQPAVAASAEAGRNLPGGEALIAVTRSFDVVVTDGILNVRFTDLGDGNPPENPKVSAIAVYNRTEEAWVHTGDANGDGEVNIADAVFILGFLFADGREPYCMKAADPNNDGSLDIADTVTILGHLFAGNRLLGPDGEVIPPGKDGCFPYSSELVAALGCETSCK